MRLPPMDDIPDLPEADVDAPLAEFGPFDRTYIWSEFPALSHVSYRMIDYWIRTDAIRIYDMGEGGSGSRRRFSALDIRRFLLLDRLIEDLAQALATNASAQMPRTLLQAVWAQAVCAGENWLELVPQKGSWVPKEKYQRSTVILRVNLTLPEWPANTDEGGPP